MKCSVLFSVALCLGETAAEGFFRSIFQNSETQTVDPIQYDSGEIRDLHVLSQGRRGMAAVNVGYDFSLAVPSQTFFIPFPETALREEILTKVNTELDSSGLPNVRGQMVSIVSIAISTDNTVIWLDHWEDGYEKDIKMGIKSNYTQVWGDGKASNGCRPGLAACTDADDYLNAGTSFVMENMMPVPRTATNWFMAGLKIDGGDKFMASFPITITRGCYSEYPGSVLAGAVEVYDTDRWGTKYEAPMGSDVVMSTDAFQNTWLIVMAGADGTSVLLPNGVSTVLNQGQSIAVLVNQGDRISSSAPIQVDLCAGDLNSHYEMRWWSVLPSSDWSDAYISPVGDGYGRSKVIIYNPGTTILTVAFTYISNNSTGATSTENYDVQPRKHVFSRVVPTGSGALVKSVTANRTFVAMSMTDTELTVGEGSTNINQGGQRYEWGATLPPVSRLTPQVLVGWGYGCTKNDCQGNVERSCVWLTPVDDADIYIDYKNIGTGYTKLPMKKLQSARIRDKADTDMSGAIIFATKPGTGPTGIPVDIVTAWGQDPSVSDANQDISMDLGTTVLPFSTVRVKKVVDKATASPGDILTYTITVQNVGQVEFKAGTLLIVDPAAFQGRYVPGTTQYSIDNGATMFAVTDDVGSGTTPFPLDGAGLPSQRDLPRRGGVHIITFKFEIVADILTTDTLVNSGWLDPPSGPNLPFDATTKLIFNPAIKVENTVYIGNIGEQGCPQAVESVTDVSGTNVTYCFKVTNTGSTYLDFIQLSNADLGIPNNAFTIPRLAPGASKTVTKFGTISTNLINTVTAVGKPVYNGGTLIPGYSDVAATDPSEVKVIAYSANITIENTVYIGNYGARECPGAGVEKVADYANTTVTYCFKITNTGNSYLTSVKINDPLLSYVKTDFQILPPGGVVWASLPSTIKSNLVNVATATGTPSSATGTPIVGMSTVSAQDPSEVAVKIDTDKRSDNKTAPELCMQHSWEDAGNSQDLVCRAKEVYLTEITSVRASCKIGSMIKVNLTAWIHFNSDRYDTAWYVAKDGGDALTGTCAIGGLVQGRNYTVTDGKGGPTVGNVTWNKDVKGGFDKCGDVLMNGGGGGDIQVNFLQDVELKCVDNNNDSNLDVAVCFTWRVPGTDGFCTLSRNDSATVGLLADAYPGTPSKCFCTVVDIPTITPTPTEPISPC